VVKVEPDSEPPEKEPQDWTPEEREVNRAEYWHIKHELLDKRHSTERDLENLERYGVDVGFERNQDERVCTMCFTHPRSDMCTDCCKDRYTKAYREEIARLQQEVVRLKRQAHEPPSGEPLPKRRFREVIVPAPGAKAPPPRIASAQTQAQPCCPDCQKAFTPVDPGQKSCCKAATTPQDVA